MSQAAITVTGTGVVAGCAFAPASWKPSRTLPPMGGRVVPVEDREIETRRLRAATAVVAERYITRASIASGAAADVLETSASLVKDRAWIRVAIQMIESGSPAEHAVAGAIAQFVEMLRGVGGRIAERATDLRDIRDRVVAELQGEAEPGIPTPKMPVILLADDLAPADAASLDPSRVLALCTRRGGPTSHFAIVARELGIPCVVGVAELRSIRSGVEVLVNGADGTIKAGVPPVDAGVLVAADSVRRDAIRVWRGPGRTRDGVEVELLANVQDAASARHAAEGEARGIGLFRTELCFLSAKSEPSVDEQARVYREVIGAFPESKVVVRTFDAGSDKVVPFIRHVEEENPALGVRGIRLEATYPGLVKRQLDAIAAAADQAGADRPWVMAPMVATVEEATSFAAKCRDRGLSPGIMVEVPSVVLMVEEFLAEVDFLSIGTNDLAQYTMAADRSSGVLTMLTTPWQPAVLRMVQWVADAGQRFGKPVGVCGEAAADPLLSCVLLGMGVTSLSMTSNAIPAVGVQLSQVTLAQCQDAAKAVAASKTAAEAQAAAVRILTE